MKFVKEFSQFIKQQNLFQQKDKLLLAVSGGVDSVVLCELCKQAGYEFVIAHCNFQLRGAESERDEVFVRSLEKKYNVEVLVKKFDTEKYAEENKLSIQVAARDLRYAWFKEVAKYNYIVTAHHANDNMETLLMNFFKGTGIKGLHGILSKQNNIVRPLLFAKKEELFAFATENQLEFVEDSSNTSDKYTRNYFRNELIPGLQKVFPQVEDNLLSNIERFKEIELLYSRSIDQHKKKLLEPKGNEIHIPVLKLLKAEPLSTIVYEIIKDFGFTPHQTEDVIGLLKSESGKFIESLTHRVIKNRNWIIISSNITTEAAHIQIEERSKIIEFANGRIDIEIDSAENHKLKTSPLIAQFDAAQIKFPLLLRKWKKGDYFYPLGMNKKKKLSRFFGDLKLSLTQKEKIWVVETDKKIIWIAGLRIDDRFKITDKTKQVLQFTLTGSE